jgi:hypothetical protein
MRRFLLLTGSLAAIALTALLCAAPASAQTIVQNVGGDGSNDSDQWRGQSFTTPAGGPWNNIRFNQFAADNPAVTPFAVGTGYLLSQEYLGTPAGLSNAVPGFLAQSTGIVGGAWMFPSALTLQPNTEYWFYGADQIPEGATAGGNNAPGSTGYSTTDSGTPFEGYHNLPGDMNYRVSGTVIGVAAAAPEPGTLAMLGAGVGIAGLMARRRRK